MLTRHHFAWSGQHLAALRIAAASAILSGSALAQLGEPAPQPQPVPPVTTPAQPVNPTTPASPADAPRELPKPHPVEVLRAQAAGIMPTIACVDAGKFLLSVGWLPVVDDRVVWVNREKREALSEMQFAELPEDQRAGFEQRTLPAEFYYNTRYGSPLAYVRALELLCPLVGDVPLVKGRRILDYGYGNAVHLRMLASLGSDVVGVDVDPILPALYSNPDDTGTIPGALLDPPAPAGRLTLVHGSWPSDEKIREKVGGGYDLIISKNTLKNGYINPAKDVDPRMLVQLGVSNEAFVAALAGALKPGGLLMIYNLSPKQTPEKYIPWADGRCPFPREMLEAAGFEVLELDKNDDVAARRIGQLLGWDTGDQPMDLENDLFGLATIVRKRP
jgi:SAM-dependent methyltransferase